MRQGGSELGIRAAWIKDKRRPAGPALGPGPGQETEPEETGGPERKPEPGQAALPEQGTEPGTGEGEDDEPSGG